MLAGSYTAGEPLVVYTGPKRTGAALIAAVAADDQKQVTRKRGKKSQVAAKKPDADKPRTAARTEAKSDKPAAKPAAVRHANAKPEGAAKPAAKPAASTEKPATKPAKPKAAAKPKSETKPAG